MDTEFVLKYVMASAVASIVGALMSLAFLALKVLPGKINRTDVQDMLDTQPLHLQVQSLKDSLGQSGEELRGIREQIVGLRTDVARLTTTLELMLKGRV